jgi:hypothetical protein
MRAIPAAASFPVVVILGFMGCRRAATPEATPGPAAATPGPAATAAPPSVMATPSAVQIEVAIDRV